MTHQLIEWGFAHGYNIVLGQVHRPFILQLLYFFGFNIIQENNTIKLVKIKRRSKTLKGKHLDKLAADYTLFIAGKYIKNKEKYRPLGEYWESLGGRWGGRFGVKPQDYAVSVGWDSGHFEY